jgi:hypothetical protein
MKLDLYQRITVNRDVPEENLKKGDVAWLIDYIAHPEGGEDGAILEIFNILGESMTTAIVPISAVESLRADQIPSVRTLAETT